MKIGIVYNVWHAGGCEKRAAEICKTLRLRGDKVWLLGSGLTHEGQTMLFDHCGLEREWVRTSEATPFAEWIGPALRELRCEVADVQWNCQLPRSLGLPTVVTAHGDVPMPERGEYDWRAFIQVETFEPDYYARNLCAIYREVWNWVDLSQYPFSLGQGSGLVYFGRLFKTGNLRAIWNRYPGRIHVYGMKYPEDNFPWPPNAEWKGFCNPAEVITDYQVVFGGARVALEAMASGRAVIAGYDWPGWIRWADCVTPANMRQMSERQFVGQRRDDGTSPPNDNHVWIQLVQALAQHHDTFARKTMRQWVEDEHDMIKQIGKIREVYEEVLAC